MIDAGWQLLTAGEIGEFRGGSVFAPRFQGQKSGELPFFKVSDMNNPGNEVFMCRANNYISEAQRQAMGATRIPAGAVVFAKVGAAIFLERKRILSQDSCIDNNMAALILDAAQAEIRFVHYLLTAFRMSTLVATTALPALTAAQLRAIPLLIPSDLQEQQRVSCALGDVDDLIAGLERVSVKKQAIKQGLAEQLLAGRTRLPGFGGDWSNVALGDIAAVEMGQSPPGSTYNETHGLPLIQGNADIRDRTATGRVRTTQPSKVCAAGDVILTVRAPVGFAAYAPHSACLGRGVCSLNAKGDNRFLFHSLVFAERHWAAYEQGSTFTSVNSTEIRSFRIGWPADEAERTDIARVLDAADREINALKQRIAKAVAVRTGMMQELLSGRTRLPVAETA